MAGNRPYLIDTTLRDGEQKAGFAIRESDKPVIAAMLDEFGVDEIETGIPAMGEPIRRTIETIDAMPLACRRTVWCRAKEEDIDLAASCHEGAVHLSLPVSTRLRRVYGMSAPELFRLAERMIGLARGRFAYVSVGAQDASRSNQATLRTLCTVCSDAGADRLRLADTVGVWTPFKAAECIGDLAGHTGSMELGIHAHNDLGMATANTLAAMAAGASSADVTILGIGERAGNAALEQVVTAGLLTEGYFAHVTLPRLKELCRSFAAMTGIAVPDSQPVVGEGVVRHESGIHVHALLRDAASYQPFAPERVGHDGATYVLGKHSGVATIRFILARAGIDPQDEHASRGLLEDVRQFAEQRGSGMMEPAMKTVAGG